MKKEVTIHTIGVIGAGTMGSGIALAALYAGLNVVLQDPFPDSLTRARVYLDKFLARKDMGARMSAVHLTADLGDLAPCQVVIEAALEDLELKKTIFRELESICTTSAILATNTSTLSVSAIAAGVQNPARVAGMHFFNPAPVLPLVEVVRGAESSDETIAQLLVLARQLGKQPVETGDTPGFIVNRVARPFYGEALRLLGEGSCSVPEIDQALRLSAGFKLGPFELMDLIGVDINATAMISMYEQTFGEPRYRPHWIQVQQMASGNLGRKSGCGFYDYRSENSGVLDDVVPDMPGRNGQVLIYSGQWDCGTEGLLKTAGYRPEPFPENVEDVIAVVVTQAHSDELVLELGKLDWILPEAVPIFVQCLDATLDGQLPPVKLKGRFIGFDPLFLATGRWGALVAGPALSGAARAQAEQFMHSVGRLPRWIADTPGLLTPRVVCMLANEAAFAVQDGVASPEEIDRAMRLGVNYPKGPLEWGQEIGWVRVLSILEHIHREYGEDRYRPCRLLRSWARQEARDLAAREVARRDPWDV